jgi:hypothetical protein
LGYDSADPLEQMIAERIVVSARDAGISIAGEAAPGASNAIPNCDVRLLRLRMPSPQPGETLMNFLSVLAPMAALDAAPLPPGVSAEQIYDRERAAVAGYRVVPLVWLPEVYGLGARVRDWRAPAPGDAWPFADVWLEQESR